MDKKKWLAEASVNDSYKATDFLKLMVKALVDQLVSKEGDAFLKKVNEMKQNELELLFANQTSNSQTLEGSGSSTSRRPVQPVLQSNSGSSTHGDKPTIKVEEFKNKLKDMQNIREQLRKAETLAVTKMKNDEADGANKGSRVLNFDFAMFF
jgi:hypothetical protein